MFEIEKRLGVYKPINIQDARIKHNDLVMVSKKSSKTFKMYHNYEKTSQLILTLEFYGNILVLEKRLNDLNSHIKGNLVDIHDFVEENFKFDFVKILSYFSDNLTDQTVFNGFTLIDKNKSSHEVNLTLSKMGGVTLSAKVPLTSPKYKSPRILGKFVRNSTDILRFPIIENRYLDFKNSDFESKCSKGRLTESIEYLDIGNNGISSSDTFTLHTKVEKKNLKITFACSGVVDYRDLNSAGIIEKRFKLEVAVLQRVLDCYENNTKRLKDALQMTENEYNSYRRGRIKATNDLDKKKNQKKETVAAVN